MKRGWYIYFSNYINIKYSMKVPYNFNVSSFTLQFNLDINIFLISWYYSENNIFNRKDKCN